MERAISCENKYDNQVLKNHFIRIYSTLSFILLKREKPYSNILLEKTDIIDKNYCLVRNLMHSHICPVLQVSLVTNSSVRLITFARSIISFF